MLHIKNTGEIDMIQELIAWMVTLMISIAPPYTSDLKAAVETREEMIDRYESIATDIVSVVYDDNEKPLIGGTRGREASSMEVLSIAFFESRFRKTVDKNLGKYGRGDNGNSWCLMQLNIGKGKTKEGWTGEELISDRKKCLTSGYHYMKMSFGACWNLPIKDRLSAYATGHCVKDNNESMHRVNMGLRWFAKAPKLKDEDILAELEEIKENQSPDIEVEQLKQNDEVATIFFDDYYSGATIRARHHL